MNKDYPKSLLEFEERFANEEACLSYLCQLRWANGFVCPGCGGAMHGRHVAVRQAKLVISCKVKVLVWIDQRIGFVRSNQPPVSSVASPEERC